MSITLKELLGDGARAEGFEEFTAFVDGLVAQKPEGMTPDDMCFVRLVRIMATAATEGANQETSSFGIDVPVVLLELCRAAGFAVASAALSVSDENTDLDRLREGIMESMALGVDFMIEHTRKHRVAA